MAEDRTAKKVSLGVPARAAASKRVAKAGGSAPGIANATKACKKDLKRRLQGEVKVSADESFRHGGIPMYTFSMSARLAAKPKVQSERSTSWEIARHGALSRIWALRACACRRTGDGGKTVAW